MDSTSGGVLGLLRAFTVSGSNFRPGVLSVFYGSGISVTRSAVTPSNGSISGPCLMPACNLF